MTPRELELLGLGENKLQELSDKWIAVLWNKKTQNAEVLADKTGTTIASENPIDVQLEVAELYPELFDENGKSKFDLGHVPKKLDLA